MVLSVLGWQATSLPLGRKALLPKSQKTMSSSLPSSNTSQNKSVARKITNYAGHTSNPPVLSVIQANERNTLGVKHDGGQFGYKIVPDQSRMDAFVYERSEDASETSTLYSNDSAETFRKLLEATPVQHAPARRNSVMLTQGSVDAPRSRNPPDAPCPPSIPLPQTHGALPLDRRSSPPDVAYPIYEGEVHGPRRRGGSVDSDRPVPFPEGPPAGRQVSPPANVSRRPSDASPPRNDTRNEPARMRRISSGGPVIPTGFGILPGERPPAGMMASNRPSPPMLRTSPSNDINRQRHSPTEREVSPIADGGRDRRLSVTMPGNVNERERPPARRGSQSSSSTSSSSRHSSQSEGSRGAPAPIIRSRKLSRRRKNEQIVVAGLDASFSQGQGRTVRFSEQLICPSPIPVEKRRKGWFNKKGQQLWTNDGVYVEPEMGSEYPLDLSEYPEPGLGWQNEEGIRIDMHHRLIPKMPLRPALKRGGTSGSQLQAASGRLFVSSVSIREEP